MIFDLESANKVWTKVLSCYNVYVNDFKKFWLVCLVPLWSVVHCHTSTQDPNDLFISK